MSTKYVPGVLLLCLEDLSIDVHACLLRVVDSGRRAQAQASRQPLLFEMPSTSRACCYITPPAVNG